MKDYEKKKIAELWMQGYGSMRIAKELGLNVNTVKSYCRRHGYIGDRKQMLKSWTDEEIVEPRCKCCGIFIVQKSETKKKMFCSDKCRMAWWNSHQDFVNKKAQYVFVCQNCGKQFSVYGNKGRKFCSHNCYIEHRYGQK